MSDYNGSVLEPGASTNHERFELLEQAKAQHCVKQDGIVVSSLTMIRKRLRTNDHLALTSAPQRRKQ